MENVFFDWVASWPFQQGYFKYMDVDPFKRSRKSKKWAQAPL